MAVRGVYSPEEEKMLSEWKEKSARLVGWLGEKASNDVPYPVYHRVASRDLVVHMAYAADYWNPIWRDENYARNTRWGQVIAPPFFEQCIAHGGPRFLLEDVPPTVGTALMDMGGHYWEFFRHIRIGDSFKVWIGAPKMTDVTPEDGLSPRKFKIFGEIRYVNQREETVSILRRSFINTILPPGTKRESTKLNFVKDSVFTGEDIAAIDKIADAEEIRGAVPRFWEDVEEGEELKPIVMGPTTIWDEVVEMQGFGVAMLPLREVRRQTPNAIAVDPVTQVPHKSIELHLSADSAKMLGSYSSTLLSVTIEHFLARLVTNWMGDDGFIRKFNYTKLANNPIGDAIFGRGRVIKKYVDDGDYVVDLDIWIESNRGYIPNVATVTVSLLPKRSIFTSK